MDMAVDKATGWLPIAEAAPRLGLTAHGLRTRIRRGLVTTRKGNDGRLLVAIVTDGAMTDVMASVMDRPSVAGELLELRVALARLEEQLAAARALAAAETAAHEVLTLELRASLEQERGERTRLMAELVEARKGWLERLLEAVRKR